MEEENAKLKQERADWSKKLEGAVKRAKGLEVFIGDYAHKIYTLLEGNSPRSSELCQFQSSDFPCNSIVTNLSIFLVQTSVRTSRRRPSTSSPAWTLLGRQLGMPYP